MPAGRPKGARQKLRLKYSNNKLAQYRQIIDYCLKCGVEGTMSQRQVEAMVRSAKSGAEVFVAEQYMKQIGLDMMDPEQVEAEPQAPAVTAREEIMEAPEIPEAYDVEFEMIEGPEEEEITAEDLW